MADDEGPTRPDAASMLASTKQRALAYWQKLTAQQTYDQFGQDPASDPAAQPIPPAPQPQSAQQDLAAAPQHLAPASPEPAVDPQAGSDGKNGYRSFHHQHVPPEPDITQGEVYRGAVPKDMPRAAPAASGLQGPLVAAALGAATASQHQVAATPAQEAAHTQDGAQAEAAPAAPQEPAGANKAPEPHLAANTYDPARVEVTHDFRDPKSGPPPPEVPRVPPSAPVHDPSSPGVEGREGQAPSSQRFDELKGERAFDAQVPRVNQNADHDAAGAEDRLAPQPAPPGYQAYAAEPAAAAMYAGQQPGWFSPARGDDNFFADVPEQRSGELALDPALSQESEQRGGAALDLSDVTPDGPDNADQTDQAALDLEGVKVDEAGHNASPAGNSASRGGDRGGAGR